MRFFWGFLNADIRAVMVRRILLISLLLGLPGCDARNIFARDFENDNPISSNAYNYTRYDVIDITYQDASERADVLRASPGGSAYAYEETRTELGSGIFVHSREAVCCFNWKQKQWKQGRDIILRVKWLAVRDRAQYEQASIRVDERMINGSIEGSQWCEALVKVEKPYPAEPGVLSIHFLPDGTVKAYAGKYGNALGIGPLPPTIVLAHTNSLSPVLCKSPTSNPFYKIARPPHRE